MRTPRFEVVRGDAGWFARFVAGNGQKIWQTEIYQRRAKAIHAIELVLGMTVFDVQGALFVTRKTRTLEVRLVHERGTA